MVQLPDFYKRNRQVKEEGVQHIEERIGQRNKGLLACAILDLDHFQQFAQSLEANEVDALLSECLESLREIAPTQAEVRSYGRDEFLVSFPVQSLEEAMFATEQIRSTFTQKLASGVHLRDTQAAPVPGCSAGAVVYPIHARDAMALLGKAEEGLYIAKQQGRNLTRFPSRENMSLKSNYYSNTQLERLAALAKRTGNTEASLLRKALDHFLSISDE